MSEPRVLVINVVGLTPGGLGEHTPALARFATKHGVHTLQPPLPAVTCTSQATMTTGELPFRHGIVSNGWYLRDLSEIRFWNRSDHLVSGEKLWEAASRRNPHIQTALLFWRHCTHARAAITVTERPTYWADGRKGPDIYTEPESLRNDLVAKLGPFPLFRFWGPATSIESTQWISEATQHVMHTARPHLVLTYLPHLDYDVQKFGPNSPESHQAHRDVDMETGKLIEVAQDLGYEIVILSEYGITPVSKPVYLNRVLRKAGYLRVQQAQNGELLEPGACRAFAVCSHQVAHIYVSRPEDMAPVRQLLIETEGVEQVLDQTGKQEHGLDHPRSGEFIAVAEPGSWFAYPYWLQESAAPDFARCVAIHDKPGHDPCEMFLTEGLWQGKAKALWRLLQNKLGIQAPFDVISLKAERIRGSHGRLPESDEERPILLTSWPLSVESPLPMTEIKPLILQRIFGG